MMSSRKKCRIEQQQQLSDNNEEMRDLINVLSLESLAKIFMLLPIPERIAMEKVCSKWKDASVLAWHDIKKYECSRSICRAYDNRMLTQSDVEEILLRCGKYLKELTLSKVCNSSIMPIISDQCKNLTRLECSFSKKLNINDTNHYVQGLKKLDKLQFIKIYLDDDLSFDTSCNFPSEIIDSLPDEINEIHLTFFYQDFRIKHFISNFKKFNNLQKLTISGFHLHFIINEILKIKTLVYLDISDSCFNRKSLVFDELVNLEHINLVNDDILCDETITYNISDELINSIFNTCKNLKHFEVSDASHDYKPTISLENWTNLENLVHLNICWGITDEFASKIVKYCKKLKFLKIYSCDYQNTTQSALTILTKLENLECLELPTYDWISEESITEIFNNCKKMKHLEIPYFIIIRSIDHEPVTSPFILDNLSKLENLEHLNLSGIANVEDNTVIVIAHKCKKLKYLNISECDINESALIALTSLDNLEDLNISFNDNVTDNFIVQLKKMVSLYCDGCRKITVAGVIQFIKNCPNLKTLDLTYIDNITIDTIIAADQATKNRINSILTLYTSKEIKEASMMILKSPCLVIENYNYY